MGKDYVKCDCCGKKIFFGDVVYFHNGFCATYCSAECYADSWGDSAELDEELAKDNGCEIFNDEQRKKELQLKLEKLEFEKEKAQEELNQLNLQ